MVPPKKTGLSHLNTPCKQSELYQLCAFTFPDSKGYHDCEYTLNWPIKNSNDGQSVMGNTKVPQIWAYNRLLIDGPLKFILWIAYLTFTS